MSNQKPLIYACSGCSLAGCRAYLVAQEMAERGVGTASCLAGLAARKPSFMKEMEGREIWVVDGCAIECAKGVVEQLQVPNRHIRLHDFGVHKTRPNQVSTSELVDSIMET